MLYVLGVSFLNHPPSYWNPPTPNRIQVLFHQAPVCNTDQQVAHQARLVPRSRAGWALGALPWEPEVEEETVWRKISGLCLGTLTLGSCTPNAKALTASPVQAE